MSPVNPQTDQFILPADYLGDNSYLGGVVPTLLDELDIPQTTDEFWEVDGVGLNTYAWNISTFDGRSGIPVTRGDNIISGDRPGAKWRRKPPDQRTITLAMWVQGTNALGHSVNDLRAVFNANHRAIKRMFGVYDRQLVITRRLRLPPPDNDIVLTALAEPLSSLEVTMQGPAHATMTIDLRLADPFWYAAPQSIAIPLYPSLGKGTAFPLANPFGFGSTPRVNWPPVLNPGGDQVCYPTFVFTGSQRVPSIEIENTGETWTWLGTLDAHSTLIADMKEKTVEINGKSVYSQVDRLNSTWIGLQPDEDNVINYSSQSDLDKDGLCTVTASGVWL